VNEIGMQELRKKKYKKKTMTTRRTYMQPLKKNVKHELYFNFNLSQPFNSTWQ